MERRSLGRDVHGNETTVDSIWAEIMPLGPRAEIEEILSPYPQEK